MQTKRFVMVWLAFTAAASAQNFYPKKDAVFGQVVVGGGYETVINLTNRGDFAYYGILSLFRGDSVMWNPTVNGTALENGEFVVEIEPRKTVTLRLTGSQLESGAAVLISEDLMLDNLIEANLTYLIRKDGRVSDSVGISPSKEFYRASIPFEKFAETALALVNGNTENNSTAEIKLTLVPADGGNGVPADITLGPVSHRAKFLHEIFRGQTLEGGNVEIASNVPIFGTALTFSGGQFSSLPLEPAPVTYSVRLEFHDPLESRDHDATGELALWAEGSFIRGYMVISAADGQAFPEPEFSLVNGELEDGRLRLAFTILQDPFFNEEVTMSLGKDEFSFDTKVVEGKWIQLFQNEEKLTGEYEFTRISAN